ncbi:MAG: sulfur carrier protein ThiS [Acidobacteriota bacterium]
MHGTMNLQVNGQRRSVPQAITVGDLIRVLDVRPERIAVELNRRIVKKTDWVATTLQEGDRVEIVQFVGGG